MSLPTFNTRDVYDFTRLPDPFRILQGNASGLANYNVHEHPCVGALRYSNLTLPFAHAADMFWDTRQAVRLLNPEPSETVCLVFHLAGTMITHYEQFGDPFGLTPGSQFLVYSPRAGYSNHVDANRNIHVFQLSVDRSWLLANLRDDHPFTAKLLHALEHRRPFATPMHGIPMSRDTVELLRLFRELDQEGSLGNLIAQAKMMEFIAVQMRSFEGPDEASRRLLRGEDLVRLAALKEQLDVHFLQDHSLEELSRSSLLNEFKLKKGFKETYGYSVFGYLKKLRMEHAAKLLRDGMSVTDVSIELGYQHTQHFSTAFRNFHGATPSKR